MKNLITFDQFSTPLLDEALFGIEEATEGVADLI
jgi:hypothetical protein